MKHISLILIFLNLFAVYSQSTVTIFKTRPSEIELINYSKIRRSNVNNSTVEKYKINEKIEDILGKYGTLKVIAPNSNNGKLENDSTIIIEYEVIQEIFSQTLKDRTTLLKQPSGDNNVNYYEAKGELTVKFRLIDAKTNLLVTEKSYSSAANKKAAEADWQDQAPRVDLSILSNQCVEDIGYAILKYISNWNEKITVEFEDDNKFIELPFVIKNINENNWEAALQTLNKYSEDPSFKSKQKAKACYNYGIILMYDNQFDKAKEMFKQALLLFPKESSYESKYDLVEQERKSKQILLDRELKKELELKKAKEYAENAKIELAKFNTVKCAIGEAVENIELMATLQISQCTFRNFMLVDSILTDDDECLAPECNNFTFFKKINDNLKEINMVDMFNSKIAQFEQEINRKSRIELNKLKNDMSEEGTGCYYRESVFENHSFNRNVDTYQENAIEFFRINENGITFRTTVGYDDSECGGFQRGTGMLFITFSFDEMQPYFAE